MGGTVCGVAVDAPQTFHGIRCAQQTGHKHAVAAGPARGERVDEIASDAFQKARRFRHEIRHRVFQRVDFVPPAAFYPHHGTPGVVGLRNTCDRGDADTLRHRIVVFVGVIEHFSERPDVVDMYSADTSGDRLCSGCGHACFLHCGCYVFGRYRIERISFLSSAAREECGGGKKSESCDYAIIGESGFHRYKITKKSAKMSRFRGNILSVPGLQSGRSRTRT